MPITRQSLKGAAAASEPKRRRLNKAKDNQGHDATVQEVTSADVVESKKEQKQNIKTQKQNTEEQKLNPDEGSSQLALPTPDTGKLSGLSFELIETFSAKSTTDSSSCSISKMVAMPSGHIVATDFSNDKVKLFSPNNTFCDEVKQRLLCMSITILDDVTVCVGSENLIKYYTIEIENERIVDASRWICVSINIYDIHYSKGIFVVLGNRDGHACVCTVKQNGDINNIITDKERKVSMGEYIHYNEDNSTVLLSGCQGMSGNDIICYSLDGEVLWKVSLCSSSDLYVIRGDIIVASCLERTVYQVTRDTNDLKSVIKMNSPKTLAYHEGSEKLYVGAHRKEMISVYRIQKKNEYRHTVI